MCLALWCMKDCDNKVEEIVPGQYKLYGLQSTCTWVATACTQVVRFNIGCRQRELVAPGVRMDGLTRRLLGVSGTCSSSGVYCRRLGYQEARAEREFMKGDRLLEAHALRWRSISRIVHGCYARRR